MNNVAMPPAAKSGSTAAKNHGIVSVFRIFWGREMGQAQQQPVQPTVVAEQISALMDGESAAYELDAAFDAAKSNAGMGRWREFQLIGDALRSEELIQAESSAAFLDAFSARFDGEPHLLAPAAAQAVATHRLLVRPSWVRRVVPTTAVAAAVAAVSWVVVPQIRQSADPAASTVAVVALAPSSAQAAGPVMTVSADAPMIRDPRLDDYLRAHRQAATTGVAMPYVRAAAINGANAQENSKE